jgi:hypothetical protein
VNFGDITPYLTYNVAYPYRYHFDVDPRSAFHVRSDLDPAFHVDADPDPTFHFDADSDFHQSDANLQQWPTDLRGSIVSLHGSIEHSRLRCEPS